MLDDNEKDFPSDLKELINIYDHNKAILKDILKKQKTIENKEEISKRIGLAKQLSNDIKILKDYYRIRYTQRLIKPKKEEVKIDFAPQLKLYDCSNKIKEEVLSEIAILKEVENINKLAYELLTTKQLIIYNLYYFTDFTQEEVSKVIGTSREYVKNEISKINKKISSNYKM